MQLNLAQGGHCTAQNNEPSGLDVIPAIPIRM
jgi:hypothetical protein